MSLDTNPKEHAARFNAGKINFSLLHPDICNSVEMILCGFYNREPPDSFTLYRAFVDVAAYGKAKYDDALGEPFNWMRGGTSVSQYIESALRHCEKIAVGELVDVESNCLHINHLLWNLIVAYTFLYTGRCEDVIMPDYTEVRSFSHVPTLFEDIVEVTFSTCKLDALSSCILRVLHSIKRRSTVDY